MDGTTVVEAGFSVSAFTTPSLGKYAKAMRERELEGLDFEDGSYVLREGQEISFDFRLGGRRIRQRGVRQWQHGLA